MIYCRTCIYIYIHVYNMQNYSSKWSKHEFFDMFIFSLYPALGKILL